MTTISKYAVTTAVLLTLGAGLALAQQAPAPTPPAPGAATDPAQVADADPQNCMDGDGMGHQGRKHGRHHGGDMCGDGGGHHGHGGHGGMGRRAMILDANGDGFIGPDEAAAVADGVFMHLDQNRDNVIDETEATTLPNHKGWRAWFGGAAPADVTAKLKAAFTERDADKDGKVTKLEFMNYAQAKYASLDTAKDGKVSPWAFRAMPRL
jgi:EF hand